MWTTFTGGGGAPSASTAGTGTYGVSGPGGWHPTVLYLGVLIVAEIIVAGWLIRLVG